MIKTFKITTLNNNRDSFEFLSEIQNQVLKCRADKIILDFSNCKFSHAVFTSLLGAIAEICRKNGIKIAFVFSNSSVMKYFMRSGLYDYMTNEEENLHTNRNALPFRKIDKDDSNLMEYIDSIINLSKLRITDVPRQQLFKNLYELFVNANEHSNEQYGVYSCGHWMPTYKKLVFSLYDTGVGIPSLVKEKISNNMTDIEALKWALIKGNSTKQLENGIPRGLGLSDLKEFIQLNKGRLTILSNGVYYDFNEKGRELLVEFKHKIIGTMVCVTINQDKEYIYV